MHAHLERIDAAQSAHETALLAALCNGSERTHELIAGMPVAACEFVGPHRVALALALTAPPPALNVVTLRGRLLELGHNDEAGALLLGDDMTQPTVEGSGHAAREIVRLHGDRLRYRAGQLLVEGKAERADVLLGEAEKLKAASPKGNSLACISASDLADLDMPAPIWFVPGLLPQGATLLCGKPKCGKSWMALSLGCAVASGGVFLSKYRCAQHEVLYLALEDTRRRLKDRLARMLHGQRPPSGLHLVTDCPRMPDGLPALEAFLDSKPLVRLLILDTLQKFRPPSGFKQLYEGDYDAITPLKQLVDRRGLALLIVHHVRKASADDVFETVSGSHGLTGAVDATLILKRNPGEFDGKLHGTGRDLEDVELPVRFNQDGNWSAVEGNATLPPARADLVEAIRQAGRALTAHELAERVGKSLDATKKLLTAAREAGTIIKNPDGLGYALPIYSTSPTSPYKSNPPTPLYSPIGGEQGSMGEQGICTPSVEVEL